MMKLNDHPFSNSFWPSMKRKWQKSPEKCSINYPISYLRIFVIYWLKKMTWQRSFVQRDRQVTLRLITVESSQEVSTWKVIIYAIWTFFDLIWLHLTSFDFIWPHLTSFDLIWSNLTLFDLIWLHLTSFDLCYLWFLNIN